MRSLICRKGASVTTLIATLMATGSAGAINLQTYQFTDSYRYSILDDTGHEHFQGPLVLTGSLSHTELPVVVTSEDNNDYVRGLVDHFEVLSLGGSYRFESLPLTLGLEAQFLQTATVTEKFSYLGDTRVKAKYRVWNSERNAISLNPELILPTGDADRFGGVGSVAGKIRAVWESQLSDLHLLASLGYGSADKNQYQIIDYRQMFLTSLGLSWDLTEKLGLNFETYRDFAFGGNTRQDDGDLFVTLKHKTFEDGGVYGGFGLGGIGEWERKNWTLFAGVKKAFFGPGQKEESKPVITSRVQEDLLGEPDLTENIYFGNNLTQPNSGEMQKIVAIAEKAKKIGRPVVGVFLEGFASKVGQPEPNQRLSEDRAEMVRGKLTELGIPAYTMRTVAYGDRAKTGNSDPAKDRKVQIRFYFKK